MGGLPGDLLPQGRRRRRRSPETARELMVHDEPILVFPEAAARSPSSRASSTLRWQGRTGFARLAVEYNYPIVPVGLVG